MVGKRSGVLEDKGLQPLVPLCNRARSCIGLVVLLVSLMAGLARAEDVPSIRKGQNAVTVRVGDEEVLRYRYGDVAYKPYVERFLTPEGVNVLRDSPHDHVHHHALMFAVTVDGVNCWEENQAPGRQEHRRFDTLDQVTGSAGATATFTEHLAWTNPRTEAVLLEEQRTIDVLRAADGKASLLTWVSRLGTPPIRPSADGRLGKPAATLTGSHYHGLGMRFVRSMDTGGRFRNASGEAGEVFRGEERLVSATWCAYTAEADGHPVTVAMFDHPDNARHPATWFTMTGGFAYLSATLRLHEEPLEIAAGQPLVLRYGVALWDGDVSDEAIEELYQTWLTASP